MKLRIEILNAAAVPMQTEEFELNEHAQDVVTTVNSMVTGNLRVTAVIEKRIIMHAIPPGMVPRAEM